MPASRRKSYKRKREFRYIATRDTERNWIFGAHPSPYAQAIWKINAELQSQGLAAGQVGPFERDAMTVYCPDTQNK